MSRTKKLSVAQEAAMAEIRAWGRPFWAFPPSWGGGGFLSFGSGPSPKIRWATYKRLVALGLITETGYSPTDATQGPSTCYGRAGNGRHAILTEATK